MWDVRVKGRIVARGSQFPNKADQFVWVDEPLLGLLIRIAALIDERAEETDRRQAVRVSQSGPQDWE